MIKITNKIDLDRDCQQIIKSCTVYIKPEHVVMFEVRAPEGHSRGWEIEFSLVNGRIITALIYEEQQLVEIIECLNQGSRIIS